MLRMIRRSRLIVVYSQFLFSDAGLDVFIVTNQGGIGRGLFAESDMHRFNDHLIAEAAALGGHIKDIADSKITIIGAGKMARLLLVHLQTQKVKEITIVNRSPGSVEVFRFHSDLMK